MTRTVQRTIADPVQMAVFSNRLLSIVEDMGHTLIRSMAGITSSFNCLTTYSRILSVMTPSPV